MTFYLILNIYFSVWLFVLHSLYNINCDALYSQILYCRIHNISYSELVNLNCTWLSSKQQHVLLWIHIMEFWIFLYWSISNKTTIILILKKYQCINIGYEYTLILGPSSESMYINQAHELHLQGRQSKHTTYMCSC